MTDLKKIAMLLDYIDMLKTGPVTKANICDEIKLNRTKLKDGTDCIKIIIKLSHSKKKEE